MKLRRPGTEVAMVLWLSILGPAPNALSFAQERPAWKAEWEKVVEAAKKEGQVTVYATLGPHLFVEDFQKAYPSIRVVGVFGRSSDLVQRIYAERRAGRYVADVRIGGGGRDLIQLIHTKVADPLKPQLLLPEVADESKWFEGRHRYADPHGQYFFVFIGSPQPGSVSYNAQMVDAREFKSFEDFLHPKWKGKIQARDPRATGPGGGALRFFYHSPNLGPGFIRRLFSQMDLTITRDERLATDWLARGKFAICFFCRGIPVAKRQGLPVEAFGTLKEGAGLTSAGGIISLVNKPPHPNAAKLFLNWALSREGQIAYMRHSGAEQGEVPDSLRIDIPKDEVSPAERRHEGVTYIDVDSPERRDMEPIFKVIEEALGEANKR
jgi:iron(III) transport system substrate-binding protein